MPDYDVSANYIDTMVRQLKKSKQLDAVLAEMHPKAVEMAKNPWSEPWHHASLHENLGAAVVKVLGAPAYEEIVYTSTQERFAGIVLPMLKHSLSSTQRSPAAIFARMDGAIAVAMKGVKFLWNPAVNDAPNGVLDVIYPVPVGEHLEHAWRGVFKACFEVTRPGVVESCAILKEGAVFRFKLSWPATA